MIILTLTLTIPGTSAFSHGSSCIMNVGHRSEHAIMMSETVEKQITLSTSWIPGHIPSIIIGTPRMGVNLPLTYKSALPILAPIKSNGLSKLERQ